MCLGGVMVSVFAFRRMGDRFSTGAYLILFYFYFLFIYLFIFIFFFFFFVPRVHFISHASVLRLLSVQYRTFCLFVLRFSVPVNNFMSYRAEPPPPGYKPILWAVNDHRTVLQNLTVRSGQGPVSLYVGQ